MELERQLSVLHLDQQAAGREWHWAWFEHLKPQSPSLVTRFLQQGHTSSNKTTPPNRLTALAEEISQQPGIECVAWLLVATTMQIYNDRCKGAR